MRVRFIAVAAVVGACGACTLLRSLDGYEAEWGKADDAGGADAVATPDQLAPTDAGRPDVSCTLSAIVDHGPDAAASAGYLHAITLNGDALYLAAGPTAPRDGGLPASSEGAIVRVHKKTGETRLIATGLPYVSSCRPFADGVVCAVGTNVVAYGSDGTPAPVGNANGRVDDLCVGDAGVVASVSDPRDGGTATVALYPPALGGGAPKTVREMAVKLDEPLRVTCHGAYVYLSAVNSVGAPILRRYLDQTSLQPQCWTIASGLSAPISQASMTGGHVFFLGSDKRAAYSTGTPDDCEQGMTYFDGAWLGLGGDSRFVFLRSHDEVRLLWADDPSRPTACSVSLGDAGVSSVWPFGVLMQTAVFDGDDVYFLASSHVMRLHVELGK